MERLITVKDIRERYGCSPNTARKYLRQMYHYEVPLTAPQWALAEWERGREHKPFNHERTIVPKRRANR